MMKLTYHRAIALLLVLMLCPALAGAQEESGQDVVTFKDDAVYVDPNGNPVAPTDTEKASGSGAGVQGSNVVILNPGSAQTTSGQTGGTGLPGGSTGGATSGTGLPGGSTSGATGGTGLPGGVNDFTGGTGSTGGQNLSSLTTGSYVNATVAVGQGNTLGIYDQPGGNRIGACSNGLIVKVYNQASSWCLVIAGSMTGYVQTSGLNFDTSGTGTGTGTGGQNLSSLTTGSYVNATVSVGQGYTLAIYDQPTTGGTRLGSCSNGLNVRVYNRGTDWCLVIAGSTTGYVQTSGLVFGTGGTGTNPQDLSSLTTGSYVNATVTVGQGYTLPIYDQPTTGGTRLGSCSNGLLVRVYNRGADWCLVIAGSTTGYVQTSGLNFGTGGTNPQDLSGLTTGSYVNATVAVGQGYSLAIFDRPETTGTRLGACANGTTVRVYNHGTTWSLVIAGNTTGYVQTSGLNFGTGGTNPQDLSGLTTGSYVNATVAVGQGYTLPIYDRPDAGGVRLGACSNGLSVRVYNLGAVWSLVIAGNTTGYVQTSGLKINDTGTNPDVTGSFVYATVSVGQGYSLTIFTQPDTSSKTLGSTANGTIVKVYNHGTAWCLVTAGSITGYVSTSGLTFASGGNDTGTGTTATLVANDGNTHIAVYLGPSVTSGQLVVYPVGTQVRILDRPDAAWAYVSIGQDRGYVQRKYLSTEIASGGEVEASYATVTNTGTMYYAPMHAEPTITSRELSSHAVGTRVRVLRYASDWCTVEIGGVTGYMQTRYLLQNGQDYSGSTTYMFVKSPNAVDKVPLYLEASTSSRVLAEYVSGKQVRLLRTSGGWSLVSVDSYSGYIQSRYLAGSGDGGGITTGSYATVKNQNPAHKLNLREQATTSSRSLGRYPNGTSVKILDRGDTWCKVEVEGKTGYMMAMYLSFGAANPGTPGTSNPTVIGTAVVSNKNPRDKLNLRMRATTSSPSLGSYPNGTKVSILSKGTDWCQVTVGNQTGYMWTANLLMDSMPGPINPGTPSTSRTAIVTATSTYMYEKASTSSRILSVQFKNWIVTVESMGAEWSLVSSRGQTGYIQTRYLILQ